MDACISLIRSSSGKGLSYVCIIKYTTLCDRYSVGRTSPPVGYVPVYTYVVLHIPYNTHLLSMPCFVREFYHNVFNADSG